MYQFSRAIYRALYEELDKEPKTAGERARVLRACEDVMQRLATDRHYFARPARTLFNDVRCFFPLSSQRRVLDIIERHIALATHYVDEHARAGVTLDGSPLSCHATTRKATSCQRVPLPGSQYCPSHKHLSEGFSPETEDVAPLEGAEAGHTALKPAADESVLEMSTPHRFERTAA